MSAASMPTEPAHAVSANRPTETGPVTQASDQPRKIALFRSLFRGREDVYPRRFESRLTGRSGYAPACGNEWVRGLCEKPRIKCAACPNRQFLPVTDDVIRWHLCGRDPTGRDCVIGVYPMLPDESCHFLAADFDGDAWQQDASAVMETCRRLGLPAALERSRSGAGGHVWLFFAEAVPARLARDLGAHLLTETMERRPELGLASYDRLFPNQDTLPKGGFGNLIALPLQWAARAEGNSVFLDDQFRPHPDQWTFLDSIKRIGRSQLETIVRAAVRRHTVVGVRFVLTDENAENQPWALPPSRHPAPTAITGPLPTRLELVLGDEVYIPKADLPPALRNHLLRLAAFQNPDFYRAQAMRLPTYDKPRVVACAEDYPEHLALPRGCLEEIQSLLRELGIEPALRDERVSGEALEVRFQGELRAEQRRAAEALLAHDTGVLAATTAFGKTVVAAWLIARRGVSTLVLVHRQQLLEQWVERLSAWLDVPAKTIGRIGGGRRRFTGHLDVALIQSLARKGEVADEVGRYGHLVVDECHHLCAQTFERVARRAKARFVLGLSATVTRKDGHHPIIFMQCGPVRYRVDARAQAAQRPFVHHVHVRPTGFRWAEPGDDDARLQFHALYTALMNDASRNALICEDVNAAVAEGRSPLVLTERTAHLDHFAARLAAPGRHVLILRGGLRKRELQATLERLAHVPRGEPRVLIATGACVGEGFDDARLDTLFLALPVSWRGTVAQYAGRLHRLAAGKREVRIYDYADLEVPVLARMFDRRCRGYEAVGYSILLPASAVPGWPAEVPLPVDPLWKRDYAASVRRLVRDGVDVPLAGLFAQAARPPAPEAEGAARARSAGEAFLYRRLETLPQTAGRFRLNATLPIAFDQNGQMEVDLLCAEAGLTIELDGDQHLADAEAYRRDRRKDVLLQEHGYFVLRFLAGDLSRNLDAVLDAILRALDHQSRAAQGPTQMPVAAQSCESAGVSSEPEGYAL